MILTAVQGVHHVLGRDKDLLCPIKTYHQKKTKIKGNMGSETNRFLGLASPQDFWTSAEMAEAKEFVLILLSRQY